MVVDERWPLKKEHICQKSSYKKNKIKSWGLFQLEKSLSPIKRKWLYVINLNFFVWRHECHKFLLNFWLKQILLA